MSDIAETKDLPDRKGRLKTVTIYINTQPFEVDGGEIFFDKVVKLAYPTAPYGDNTGYSVMYEYSRGGQGGTLIAGKSVEVKQHMRFDVTATDRS